MVRFFFSSRRRHTRWNCDWSSDVCSSDLAQPGGWCRFLARNARLHPPDRGAKSERLTRLLVLQLLARADSIQTRIACIPHFSHTALANLREDLVGLVRICAGGDQRWSSLPRHVGISSKCDLGQIPIPPFLGTWASQ